MPSAASEPTLTPDVFAEIAHFAKSESGLDLGVEKQAMVQSRLKKRLKATGLAEFKQYIDLIRSEDGTSERRFMISALTTNVTHFFREDHHFEILADKLKETLSAKVQKKERIRIWSAGCSNGQEPYSIAMFLMNLIPEIKDADFKILATDIDPVVLNKGKSGTYTDREIENIPDKLREQFFKKNSTGHEYTVADTLAKTVVFNELNLLKTWPMRRRFDAIFCRNVVIYFDKATQETLWPRFIAALEPHGVIFLGHSERIPDPEKYNLKTVGHTTYQPLRTNQ